MAASSMFPNHSQEPLANFHSRKFLILPNQQQPQAPALPPSPPTTNFDHSNVLIVFAALLCAVICSLGLFSIIRCASSSETSSEPGSAKLANSGVEKKALKAFPTSKYTPDLELPSLDRACVICLSDFAKGEVLKTLPKCNHGFHVRCIDRWLASQSSCPTCRNCLVEEHQDTGIVQENA